MTPILIIVKNIDPTYLHSIEKQLHKQTLFFLELPTIEMLRNVIGAAKQNSDGQTLSFTPI